MLCGFVFFFKQKTAYEMRISDWSSDVCSSDLFKLQGLDAQALVEYQKRNLEAFASANKIALEGAQAVIRRQAEIVRQGVEDASKALSELSAAGTPQDKLTKQVELAKQIGRAHV